MVSDEELDMLSDVCGRLPAAKGNYLQSDFICNLFLTVLDFQMHNTTIEQAMRHYHEHCWQQVRTMADLKAVLATHPDDKDGNTALAQYLWGYRLWTRAALLRRLVAYFECAGVTCQGALRAWAQTSDFKRDFEGRIKGLGRAVYQWLVMRQGVETVKPDTHLHTFVRNVVGHPLSDEELVRTLETVASRLGVKAYELDWRIWEHQRGGAGAW